MNLRERNYRLCESYSSDFRSRVTYGKGFPMQRYDLYKDLIMVANDMYSIRGVIRELHKRIEELKDGIIRGTGVGFLYKPVENKKAIKLVPDIYKSVNELDFNIGDVARSLEYLAKLIK